MIEDKIKNILRDADQIAGEPKPVFISIPALRRRANHRRFTTAATALTALLFFALLSIRYAPHKPSQTPADNKALSLETQIKQLNAKMDATLNLINEVLEDERRQRRLNELQAQLASIQDPFEEIQQEVDKTAFILIYHADHLNRKLNQTDSAIGFYNRIIELFPKNRWAEVARQRILEIKNKKTDKTSLEGEQVWNPQSV
jgi:hypothetical protein